MGTGDDSGPYPCLRALPLTCCSCRALFAMPHGPAGTGKAAAEQSLLDEAMDRFPVLFDPGWIWLMDRNYHGAPRIARMIRSAHVLIRLKSDIPLKRTSQILPDGSYRAELSGGGVTVPVRVIEYFTDVEGQEVPEMFCLVTDLMDWEEYPARELAALCKWRWDGSETALREAKAPLRSASPGTGPMLRSGSPNLVRQELAAWAAAVGLTRGVARDAALAAAPARKGRRAGLAVRTRDLSFARAVRAVLSAIRLGNSCYQAVTSEIAEYRNAVDRDRHRARKSKSPSSFAHAGRRSTVTRIAPAVPAFVDVVGEVGGDALGTHSERGRDELGIQGVDQLGGAGAAEQPGPDACRVQDVAEVVGRRRVLCALGLPGDQDVLVGGAELGAVVQAPLQGGPGGRVQGRGACCRPSWTACAAASMPVMTSPRSSAQVAPCSRASRPVRDSCG